MPHGRVFQSALDILPVHFAVLDAGGSILWTNRAWREFSEANDVPMRPDSLGVNYLAALTAADETYARRTADGLRTVLDGEREQFELAYPCHASDDQRWFLLRSGSFTLDGAQYATVVHVEITDRKVREQALHDAYEISSSADLSFEDQIDAFLELVRDVVGTEFGTLSRVHGDEYVFEAVAAPPGTDLEAGTTAPIGTLPNCEHVVEHERTIALEDVEAEAPELADSEWGISSYLGAPVMVDGEVYGTFCFYSTEPREEAFSEWAVTFVDLLSTWTGYELERLKHERRLQQIRENVTDVVWMTSPEKDEIMFVSDAYEDVWGRSPDTVVRDSLSFVESIHPNDRDRVREAIAAQRANPDEYEETYRVVQPDGEVRWVHDQSAGVYDDDGSLDCIVGVATDITARKEYEQTLVQQRDELAQLQRLNALVRKVTSAVQKTATREAMETAVCTHLTESDLYQSVWIGTRGESATGEPAVIPQTAAGVDESSLDDIADLDGPAWTALLTGETQVVDDVATDESFPDARPDLALQHDHRTLAAVPLATGETTYGVLVVCAPRDQAISDAEREVLSDLGRSIALSIQRVYSQRSLRAETVVTLDLRIPDAQIVFSEVSAELKCEIELERQVSTSNGTRLHYATVSGAEPAAVCEQLERASLVDACTVVRDAEGERPALVEVHHDGSSRHPLSVLSDYGASVETARATDGDVHLTVELAPEIGVRTVLDAVRTVAPTVKLVSKQYVDRPTTTVAGLQEQIKEALTSKQQAALESAYTRGYYSWPRDSTMEEIAESFGVSGPTFNYRLRIAHQTVMAALFENDCAHDDVE